MHVLQYWHRVVPWAGTNFPRLSQSKLKVPVAVAVGTFGPFSISGLMVVFYFKRERIPATGPSVLSLAVKTLERNSTGPEFESP